MTDADENGDWSFLAPAGKIRVSAFAGVYDDTFAIQDIQSGEFANGFGDVLTEVNDDREVYAITAILGEVANMTWLGETMLNITGAQADRHEDVTTAMDIEVQSTGVSGTVTWTVTVISMVNHSLKRTSFSETLGNDRELHIHDNKRFL